MEENEELPIYVIANNNYKPLPHFKDEIPVTLGVIYTIIGKLEGRFKIKGPNETEGWVPENEVEAIVKTVVLLGVTGAGKSSTANSICKQKLFADKKGFKRGTSEVTTKDCVIPGGFGKIRFVDTPGFGDTEGQDQKIFNQVNEVVRSLRFVDLFMLVIKADSRLDDQQQRMIEKYLQTFKHGFTHRLVFVITHWDMSNKAIKKREYDNKNESQIQQEVVDELHEILAEKFPEHKQVLSKTTVVFIDNNFDEDDEVEQACHDASVLQLIAMIFLQNPIPTCAIESLETCNNCAGIIIPEPEVTETMFVNFLSSGISSTARFARVINGVSNMSSNYTLQDVAIKAMSRGWNFSAGGVHSFGSVATKVGYGAQVLFCAWRLKKAYDAGDKKEAVKAVAGTTAAIGGSVAGLKMGALIGSYLFPGVGTVVGGIVGAIGGGFVAQSSTEKVIDIVGKVTLCPKCLRNKIEEKEQVKCIQNTQK